jgi:hypothetical protein
MDSSTNMPCQELVALVTAYLDACYRRPSVRASTSTCGRPPSVARTWRRWNSWWAHSGRLRRSEREENRAEKARLVQLFRTRGLHSRARPERS